MMKLASTDSRRAITAGHREQPGGRRMPPGPGERRRIGVDHDHRAVPGEQPLGHGPADAAAAAGDHVGAGHRVSRAALQDTPGRPGARGAGPGASLTLPVSWRSVVLRPEPRYRGKPRSG